ncbi:hypothetical protein C5468_10540 [Photorhabdus luminescens subsp. mexicana]|uniref:Uncharacterized protein n=1 Tax=Photorhabdus luminescens subsp. mexicana TaxID=2100167 RepID=A0A4R4JF63_PHOLU|nr:hypothetical protein C5468_10540 [Photorhabdus luminescens subsp. mexicana]
MSFKVIHITLPIQVTMENMVLLVQMETMELMALRVILVFRINMSVQRTLRQVLMELTVLRERGEQMVSLLKRGRN